MDVQANVAANAKEIRKKKRLTLEEASRLTGVSRSMLSAIENGEVNPTISVIWKIADGYKVKFSALLEDRQQAYHIIREKEIQTVSEDDGRYINYPVFPFDDRRLFETYRIRIEPGGNLEAKPHMPGTEEYITVFAGQVCITAGEESVDLAEGDSIHFLADVPHAYRNTGRRVVWLSTLLYYRPL